jgi:hypothetical protein
MADRLDVAERIAEGGPAAEHTQRYVRAAATLGYEHPDLTARALQIREWYDSEEGLNLLALDGDCAQLRAAGVAATEALRIQRCQIAELTAAWTGPGANSAVDFLQRHCDAAAMVATELRAAAQRCESLRDNLWYLLDVKVATAVAIDDRTAAQRSAWLAAADAVTTGAGDRQAAQEVIEREVMPFVDNDIRDDWVNAMRSTRAGVAAAYDMVIDRMAAAPAVQFDVPAEFVPGRAPFQAVPAGAPPAPAAAAPGVMRAAAAPMDAAPAPPASAPNATAAPAMPLPDLGTALGEAMGVPGGAGSTGAAVPGGLGGLSGLADRIIDAMGSLFDSAGDPSRPDGADDPFAGEGDEGDERGKHGKGDKDGDDAFKTEPSKGTGDDKPNEVPKYKPDLAAPVPPPEGPPTGPKPAGASPPAEVPAPGAVPPPVPVPDNAGSTPCQTAPDQLPQAGG